MSADLYREQVALLLRLLPIVGREEMFALKGGTAINLFVRDLPRLSVDIDLTSDPRSRRIVQSGRPRLVHYHREASALLAVTPVCVRLICHRDRTMVGRNEVIDSIYLERERSLLH